jgi:hypothetical protein
MARLQRHDVGVDGHAKRNAHPTEAHDCRGGSHDPHRPEGEQDHQRQRQQRNEGAAYVKQEQ